MFNWLRCILLIAISISSTLVVLPRTMRSLATNHWKNLKPGQPMPSARALLLISCCKLSHWLAIAAVIGTLLTPEVGLSAPFFEAVTAGDWSAVGRVCWLNYLCRCGLALVGAGFSGDLLSRFSAENGSVQRRTDRKNAQRTGSGRPHFVWWHL